ncbi:MAG: hypothetical protein WKH64_07565 [Chloroflexia bacterium]
MYYTLPRLAGSEDGPRNVVYYNDLSGRDSRPIVAADAEYPVMLDDGRLGVTVAEEGRRAMGLHGPAAESSQPLADAAGRDGRSGMQPALARSSLYPATLYRAWALDPLARALDEG